jgi:hypothetical protein
MAMNAEKQMHAKSQRASELEKTMGQMSDTSAERVAEATGQDPELIKTVQRLQVKDSIRDFFETYPEARQYEAQMAQIAESSGLYGTPEAILRASYNAVLASSAATLKSQGKREGLESLAHKQQAAVPRGNAVNSGATSPAITPENVDALVGKNDLKWFESHRDEINAAMAG